MSEYIFPTAAERIAYDISLLEIETEATYKQVDTGAVYVPTDVGVGASKWRMVSGPQSARADSSATSVTTLTLPSRATFSAAAAEVDHTAVWRADTEAPAVKVGSLQIHLKEPFVRALSSFDIDYAGTADNTTVLQAALADVVAWRKGTLRLPAGRIRFRHGLDVPRLVEGDSGTYEQNGFTIEGAGSGQTILMWDPDTAQLGDTAINAGNSSTDIRHFTMRGLQIAASAATMSTVTGTAVHLQYTYQCLLDDVQINSFGGTATALKVSTDAQHLRLNNVDIRGCYDGIALDVGNEVVFTGLKLSCTHKAFVHKGGSFQWLGGAMQSAGYYSMEPTSTNGCAASIDGVYTEVSHSAAYVLNPGPGSTVGTTNFVIRNAPYNEPVGNSYFVEASYATGIKIENIQGQNPLLRATGNVTASVDEPSRVSLTGSNNVVTTPIGVDVTTLDLFAPANVTVPQGKKLNLSRSDTGAVLAALGMNTSHLEVGSASGEVRVIGTQVKAPVATIGAHDADPAGHYLQILAPATNELTLSAGALMVKEGMTFSGDNGASTPIVLDIYGNCVVKKLCLNGASVFPYITCGTGAPSGGADGDVYIRVAGASSALHFNVNGSWKTVTVV